MKHYIIITYDIHSIGGTQALAAGRATYFKNNGWNVAIFFNGEPFGDCEIPSLTEYVAGCGFLELNNRPYKISNRDRDEILNGMINILRIDSTIQNEIIIESHYDVGAYWAELLAERIHARHFFVCCNEVYRSLDRFYLDNLDFFHFKENRGELISNPALFKRLFNGYRGLQKSRLQIPPEVQICREQDAVQSIENPEVDEKTRVTNADFTIAYFGRTVKSYVPTIFQNVVKFAKKYSSQKIRFIIVGKILRQTQIQMFNGIQNIELVLLDNLVPIPRFLFERIDVICAGSCTAYFCALENVPIIVANAESGLTPGLLFYDTTDFLYGGDANQISYCEALEKVLIRKEYENRRPSLPENHPADWHYDQLLNIMRSNSTPLEYFTEKFKTDLRRHWISYFPFHKVKLGSRVVLYGYGDEGKDYIQQVGDGNFCEIVAIVADDYENYDREILPPEMLREIDYDVIVIAEYPDPTMQRIKEIVENIIRITGRRNIVYDWKPLHAV